MHQTADFRSDKCAMPTPEMIEAMTSPAWGDGQTDLGDTVTELERLAYKLTGKDAALFCISGTMANQLAIHAHTLPGDEIILGENCHTFWTEGGYAAALSGVQTYVIPSVRGLMDTDRIAGMLSRAEEHAPTTLVCTENTHNFGGGIVVPIDYLKTIRKLATAHGAKVHLDGARITNAAVKSGIPAADYAATADSVMFCLSKGLCAPVGSMLCGDADFIVRARAFMRRVGGVMKQPGPLAACGIIGLGMMNERLAEDHANAARFADGLAAIPGIAGKLDVEPSETNMVFMTLKGADADAFLERLEKNERVRAYHIAHGRMRFVTHRDIDAADVDRTIDVFRKVFSSPLPPGEVSSSPLPPGEGRVRENAE